MKNINQWKRIREWWKILAYRWKGLLIGFFIIPLLLVILGFVGSVFFDEDVLILVAFASSPFWGLIGFIVGLLIDFTKDSVIDIKSIQKRKKQKKEILTLCLSVIINIISLLIILAFIQTYNIFETGFTFLNMGLFSLFPIFGSILGFITFSFIKFENIKSVLKFNWKSIRWTFIITFVLGGFASLIVAGIGDAQGSVFYRFMLRQLIFYIGFWLAFLIPFNIFYFVRKNWVKFILLILLLVGIFTVSYENYNELFTHISEKKMYDRILEEAIANDDLERCNDLPYKLILIFSDKPIPYHNICFTSINKHPFNEADCNKISVKFKEDCLHCMKHEFKPKICTLLLKNPDVLKIFKESFND